MFWVVSTVQRAKYLVREKIIYYLLSIIYYLKSPVVQTVYTRPLRWGLLLSVVTKVTKMEFYHKSRVDKRTKR